MINLNNESIIKLCDFYVDLSLSYGFTQPKNNLTRLERNKLLEIAAFLIKESTNVDFVTYLRDGKSIGISERFLNEIRRY